MAVLPADRPLQELCVKPIPASDSLEDEEVRTARRELDVRGADDRAAVQMWRDLRVVRLRHPCDLLRLEKPADAAEIRLQDGGGPGPEHACELVLRRQTLAGGDRNRGRARDDRHLLGAVGGNGLLEPERVETLEAPSQPHSAGRRELTVRAEEQVTTVADGLSHA